MKHASIELSEEWCSTGFKIDDVPIWPLSGYQVRKSKTIRTNHNAIEGIQYTCNTF